MHENARSQIKGWNLEGIQINEPCLILVANIYDIKLRSFEMRDVIN